MWVGVGARQLRWLSPTVIMSVGPSTIELPKNNHRPFSLLADGTQQPEKKQSEQPENKLIV